MSNASVAQVARLLTGPDWRGLSAEGLSLLAQTAELCSFAQDEDLTPGIFVIIEGLVGMMRGIRADQSAVTALYLKSDLVDLTRIPDDDQDRLVALRPTRALRFPAEAFHAAMRNSPELAEAAYANIKRQAFNLREHAAELHTKSPDQRLAAFLLWIEALSGLGENRSGFDLPMRRYDLARYLGMQPETLSRKIKALVSTGAISQRSPTRLIIEDRDALSGLAVGPRRVA
ncbi:Fnr/Crp family transcriptional regulator DnrF [Dinoroseobacter shibae]|nr:Crp/Fnr family transcriptional regulator [Dinoroseobacter shibae]URF46422.1 Crp/Fnr family transcriptional regulator [Dinoroseobacter shibae]URF50728.1 Crp/Fnr family transcriptional regulator [Dinoroseobacter shibae]